MREVSLEMTLPVCDGLYHIVLLVLGELVGGGGCGGDLLSCVVVVILVVS